VIPVAIFAAVVYLILALIFVLALCAAGRSAED
jgi:hypothetical protein